jgi:hypothetical protein
MRCEQRRTTDRDDLVIFCTACFASLLVARGKPADAARLFGASIDRLDIHQEQIYLFKMIDIDHFLEVCQEQLDKPAFSLAWEAGSQMSLEQTLAYALDFLE